MSLLGDTAVADTSAEPTTERHHALLRVAVFAAALLLVGMAGKVISGGGERRAEVVQPIVLLEPEPLPEPEEIEEIELPEPEEETVELEPMEEIEPLADDLAAALDDTLGLDASGEAGSDVFGLKAKRGGRALFEYGDGDPMQRYGRYAAAIETALKRFFHEDRTLRTNEFSIQLDLWITEAGTIDQCRLRRSSGNAGLDEDIVEALQFAQLKVERPPADMPQPLRIRVQSLAAN